LTVGLSVFGEIRAAEAASENISLVGRIPAPDFTGAAFTTATAFVLDNNDLVSIDTTEAANPFERARRPLESGAEAGFNAPNRQTYTLLYGNLLYVATRGHGLQMYDVSSPYDIGYVDSLEAYTTSQALALDGYRLYIGGESLRVFDLIDPSSPSRIADLPYPSFYLAVDQGRALVSVGDHAPVKAYDLRDLNQPVSLGELDYSLPGDGEVAHTAFVLRWPKVALLSASHIGLYVLDQKLSLYTHVSSETWTRSQSEVRVASRLVCFYHNLSKCFPCQERSGTMEICHEFPPAAKTKGGLNP